MQAEFTTFAIGIPISVKVKSSGKAPEKLKEKQSDPEACWWPQEVEGGKVDRGTERSVFLISLPRHSL
jgi:hypothetical protein